MEEDFQEYKCTVVMESEDGKKFEYPCPKEAIGDIFKVLALVNAKETVSPDEYMIQRLRGLLGESITEQMVSNWTGLEVEYLQHLLQGVIEPADVKKVSALIHLVEKAKK